MIPNEKIDSILKHFAFLEAKMAEGLSSEEYVAVSKEYAQLEPVVAQARDYRSLLLEQNEAESLLTDPEMVELANEELARIRDALPDAEHKLKLALLPKDAADDKSVILEIRAGTGGDEAALFAEDLFRMYTRFAEGRGWQVELMEASTSDAGGYKEVVAALKGAGAFAALKFESGAHRVQRVPVTESGGRIHTSAATVAILPEAEEIDVEIDTADIRIDTMRASGAGGQHVNTTDSAVRITHVPTGIVVVSAEKSQHQNRERAMQVLRARLLDLERGQAAEARAEDRKSQVGSGDRSERIRTYNFPQGRVTDHRINLTLYKLDQILEGALDEVIEALTLASQAEKLAELEG